MERRRRTIAAEQAVQLVAGQVLAAAQVAAATAQVVATAGGVGQPAGRMGVS